VQRSSDAQSVIEHPAIPGSQVNLSAEVLSASTLHLLLANDGWTDGFDLARAYAYTPGAAEAMEQLQAIGITGHLLLMSDTDIAAGLSNRQIHLALLT
jgi:hypothetical protein